MRRANSGSEVASWNLKASGDSDTEERADRWDEEGDQSES